VQVNVGAAKNELSKLLARVEQGEEVVIARDGKPVAKLVRATEEMSPGDWWDSIRGAWSGQAEVDWDNFEFTDAELEELFYSD
jgi:prevent-host-death family protein